MGSNRRKAQPATPQGKAEPPATVQAQPTSGEVVGLVVTLLGARSLTYTGQGGDYTLRAEGRPITVTNKADMEHFRGDPRCSCSPIMAPKRQKA